MSNLKLTKFEAEESSLFQQLSQKGQGMQTSEEFFDFQRLSRKRLAREDNANLTDWTQGEIDFRVKIPYRDFYDALPVLYSRERLLEALSQCVVQSNSYEMLLEQNRIPPIIPLEIPLKNSQKKNYLFNIDYNYFVMMLASQFEADDQGINRFYQDFALRFNSSVSIDRISEESHNLGAKTLSNILEFFKISYLNTKANYRAMGYANSAVKMNYYAPIIIQRRDDRKGKNAIQMNCIPLRMSFIEELGYSNNIEHAQARTELMKLVDLVSEELKGLAFNVYDCNEFWICKALDISINQFRKYNKAEKRQALKNLTIERIYYS